MDQQIPSATLDRQRIVILSEAKILRSFDSAKRAIARDVSLALNMTVQLMCAARNPCSVSWTTFARHVLFWLLNAKIFYQDLWLPDERARLGTGRAFAYGARIRTGRKRIGSRRRAP